MYIINSRTIKELITCYNYSVPSLSVMVTVVLEDIALTAVSEPVRVTVKSSGPSKAVSVEIPNGMQILLVELNVTVVLAGAVKS